ncbi:MAG: AAA family ATPase, partial [Candidatus Lokiarchaeota archaeon]|nr:AAA family ATPase [Candidatus Lokiarchaeota archaeon]
MKIHKLVVQDIRGIRAPIEFRPNGQNLIICGQNGTGKSAVVDALDFLFSGDISRISGEGTGKILINQHGKNITQDDPAQAFVEAEIEVPGCNGHISLRRSFDHKNHLDYDEKYQPIIEPLLNFASHEH